jgi:BNR repeat-like domain
MIRGRRQRMRKCVFVMMASALCLCSLTLDVRADWNPAKRLSWMPRECYAPDIAIDSSDHIHVVWYDYDSADESDDVYYKKSEDGGTTWTAAQKLNGTLNGSGDPAIAIDSSGHIHVVWADYVPDVSEDIYYRRSDDGGATWSAVKRLSWTSGWSESPGIAVGPGDTIHVVWEDETPGNGEVYYKQSTDGGATWGTSKRLSSTADSSRYPVIAVSGDSRIHVAWHDFTPGHPEIYYKRSTDGGATWNAAKRLTWTVVGSWHPAMGLGSGNAVLIVWQGGTSGSDEIYLKKSTDGGATWGTSRRLTWTSGSSWSPAIAMDSSGTVHIAWGDATPGNFEMYYKKSADGGATWGLSTRLTWTSGQSYDAAVATDSGNTVHIVWEDDTPGTSQIYYKKGK